MDVQSDGHEVDEEDQGETDGNNECGRDVGPVRDDDGCGRDLGRDGDGVAVSVTQSCVAGTSVSGLIRHRQDSARAMKRTEGKANGRVDEASGPMRERTGCRDL